MMRTRTTGSITRTGMGTTVGIALMMLNENATLQYEEEQEDLKNGRTQGKGHNRKNGMPDHDVRAKMKPPSTTILRKLFLSRCCFEGQKPQIRHGFRALLNKLMVQTTKKWCWSTAFSDHARP